MTKSSRDEREASANGEIADRDRRVAELIAENYRPGPMTAQQSDALDRKLRARVASQPTAWTLQPVFATAAVVAMAVLAWFALPTTQEGEVPEGAAATELAELDAEFLAFGALRVDDGRDWGSEVLSSRDSLDSAYADDADHLPDDYLAIASLMLDREV